MKEHDTEPDIETFGSDELDYIAGVRAYESIPVVKQAMRFMGSKDDVSRAEYWLRDSLIQSREIEGTTNEEKKQQLYELEIRTLEGNVTCSPCDYIIKGLKGEFYPCKPDIFEKSYKKLNKE